MKLNLKYYCLIFRVLSDEIIKKFQDLKAVTMPRLSYLKYYCLIFRVLSSEIIIKIPRFEGGDNASPVLFKKLLFNL